MFENAKVLNNAFEEDERYENILSGVMIWCSNLQLECVL